MIEQIVPRDCQLQTAVVIEYLTLHSEAMSVGIVTGITSPNVSLRGVSDEAISWHGQEIASQSLAVTCSGK